MYVKKLELLNFQVIKEFNADFDGNVYLITGDNELGKSTLLKAIGALLTGERDSVLRKGESKGFAKMVIGDDGDEYDDGYQEDVGGKKLLDDIPIQFLGHNVVFQLSYQSCHALDGRRAAGCGVCSHGHKVRFFWWGIQAMVVTVRGVGDRPEITGVG